MGKKKSNAGAGMLALAIGVVALISTVPKEAWIFAGVVLGICAVGYLISKSKKQLPASQEPVKAQRTQRATPLTSPSSPSLRKLASMAASSTSTNPQSAEAIDEPVSVACEPQRASSGFAVPSAPTNYGAGRWIPPGETVTIAGTAIPGGMVYVGTSLPTRRGTNDPCLIDPTKPVASTGNYSLRQTNYWPSYSDVSAEARRSYLNWLAGGRSDPAADIGFVFLFFYGLERRAIVGAATDEAAKSDWPVIATELRRLLAIYGKQSDSFRRYASGLLDWVSLAHHAPRLYEQPLPAFQEFEGVPLYLKLVLGQASVDGSPLPANVALAWARLDPCVSFRTPATRCPGEFEKLFSLKYAEVFGLGMTLPRNRTKLKLIYQPASAGLRDYDELKLNFKDTPDVTVLTGPIKKLQEIVEAATKPLEGYSRMVGKGSDSRKSLEALLHLPATLWPSAAIDSVQKLKARMGDGMVAISFEELLAALGAQGELSKEKTVALARSLEALRIGFEPDVLNGARTPKPDDRVVLFHLPASEGIPRADGPYLAAILTLQLSSAVAAADGEFGIKEMGHLRMTVLSWNHFTPSQTRRLLAHLRLLMQAPASLTSLKKKFEALEKGVKETIAVFMATVAQSDGEVTPAEVKMLEKVYKALGIDAKRVFTDVHAVAAGDKVTPAATKALEATSFKLDPARIAALQKDTEKVSALLANIFNDEEEGGVGSAPPSSESALAHSLVSEAESQADDEDRGRATATGDLLGLDDAHASLARLMLSRPEWSREELLDVAADLDLMLDGALERINEAAFDAHDIPLFEGDDPVIVNTEILEKVAA